eukprot:g17246.t1
MEVGLVLQPAESNEITMWGNEVCIRCLLMMYWGGVAWSCEVLGHGGRSVNSRSAVPLLQLRTLRNLPVRPGPGVCRGAVPCQVRVVGLSSKSWGTTAEKSSGYVSPLARLPTHTLIRCPDHPGLVLQRIFHCKDPQRPAHTGCKIFKFTEKKMCSSLSTVPACFCLHITNMGISQALFSLLILITYTSNQTSHAFFKCKKIPQSRTVEHANHRHKCATGTDTT